MLGVVEAEGAVPVILVGGAVVQNAGTVRIYAVVLVVYPRLPKAAIGLLLRKCDIDLEFVERS